MSAKTAILQCPTCEGTSFEIHAGEGLLSFTCKHCGEDITRDPSAGRINLRELPGAEDASIS